MAIIPFRPFKRLKDDELIDRLYDTFKNIEILKDQAYQENMDLCDKLLKEAKYRKIHCPKEKLYKKILFH